MWGRMLKHVQVIFDRGGQSGCRRVPACAVSAVDFAYMAWRFVRWTCLRVDSEPLASYRLLLGADWVVAARMLSSGTAVHCLLVPLCQWQRASAARQGCCAPTRVPFAAVLPRRLVGNGKSPLNLRPGPSSSCAAADSVSSALASGVELTHEVDF